MISRMKRRLAVRVVAMVAAMAAALTAAAIARPALANIADCAGWNGLCMWVDSDYGGDIYRLNSDTANLGWFNDKLTSYLSQNQSNTTWLVFADANYGGDCLFKIGPGESQHNVPRWGNDQASSVRAMTDADGNLFCQG
jgi:hypothetical protein